jgi:hypothetical protein
MGSASILTVATDARGWLGLCWFRRILLEVAVRLSSAVRLVLTALAVAMIAVPSLRAQTGQGMFVTPVAGAPFVGQVAVQRTIIQPGGHTLTIHTTHMIARDAQGRIRNEVSTFLLPNSTAAPAVIRVLIYDPQNRLSTSLFPGTRTFRIFPVQHPPATDAPAGYASPAGSTQPPSQYANEQDLGTRTIAGLEVHGMRETQKIPAAQSGTGKDIVVTDEYWYSYDLKMNLSVKHADPRTGSVTMTVAQLTRIDPDPSLFAIPAGYKPYVPPQPPPHKTDAH